MRSNPRSIRSKIVLVLLVPVAALIALWALDVNASFADAAALRDSYNTRDNVSIPCDVMVAALQAERSGSVEMLAAAGGAVAGLGAQRAVTDGAVAQFRELSRRYRGSGISADITRARIADMGAAFDSLTLLRAQVDARGVDPAAVLSGYNSIISYAFSVSTAAAASSDPLVERVMRTSVALRRAGELLHQEDALLTGVTTAGRFGAGEYRQLTEIVGGLRFQIPTAGSTLPAPDQAAFKSMLSSPTFAALRSAEDQILGTGGTGEAVPLTRDVWKATFTPAVRQFYAFLGNGYDKAVGFASAERNRILWRFGISGGLGLVAILTSLFLSIRIGGSVVRRLSVLRTAAIDLAHRRLPEMVARLRAGEQIDVESNTLRLSLGKDEIADVGAALSEVQRSAVDSAAGEAALRYDMNRVLVNIARRNQSLIDRQLEALSAGGDTGRVEQLAVQMRRQAEHLVILSGSARSRRGLGPESLAAIVARAAGQVEHAERVQVGVLPDAEVPEPAVADIGHLLAELLENATTFSPPETPVRVSGHRVAEGVVVEIEDQGLGMSASALADTNRRLAQPQEFDPATSTRLGLVVVARLAAQRGIRVVLTPSGQRGITASVTLPAELAVPVTLPEARPIAGTRRSNAAKLVGMAGPRGRVGADRGAGPRHAADD
ncbi:nitrate- and nitrite sensing domain-containing protein [Actinoplanes sp. NPDC049316]|uniref:sensor histidine kinase n=1 Tax=Actinoplanes sp. NPDC049316 TaxID=3154727 RepID=UPI0034346042